MRTESLLRTLVAALVLWLVVPGFLAGCGGGGGDDGPQYALTIYEPLLSTADFAEVTLTGEGFLPPGSTCDGDCSGLLPAPVFGQLGPYTLGWRNEVNGASGTLELKWICNCGGNAPLWIGSMPLVPGANCITVTMTAGGYTQSASVTITLLRAGPVSAAARKIGSSEDLFPSRFVSGIGTWHIWSRQNRAAFRADRALSESRARNSLATFLPCRVKLTR